MAAAALFADLPLRQIGTAWIPGDLMRLLTWSEVFAHGIGAAIIVLTVYVLDVAHRRQIPRLLAAAFGAGLTADVIKLAVARVRPGHFSGDTISDSFAGWFPIFGTIEGFAWCDHRLQSFPSAHTAVAVGLACGLTAIYPRGKFLFATFAILAAGQRLACGAHYLSDVFAGAAVGCLVALAVSPSGWLCRAFHRWEWT